MATHSNPPVALSRDRPTLGILCIIAGMFCISINDAMIKQLSHAYPLHQMVFVRSAIGIMFSLIILQFEGGWQSLKTAAPGLHILRGLAIVFANMTYFAALAVLPLADATALFFVAPLFITLLSIPLLGEQVGVRRMVAVLAGLVGIFVMMQPDPRILGEEVNRWVLLLPIAAAFGYALMQILTRKLGMSSKASAMAIYLQAMFIMVSLGFWLAAGDGRHAQGIENPSLVFLLRAWSWPQGSDFYLFIALGVNSAIIAYTLSQAYRIASVATIAPFEYTALPLAIFWGWSIWGELPNLAAWIGIGLIMSAGIYVFVRERERQRPVSSNRALRRL